MPQQERSIHYIEHNQARSIEHQMYWFGLGLDLLAVVQVLVVFLVLVLVHDQLAARLLLTARFGQRAPTDILASR